MTRVAAMAPATRSNFTPLAAACIRRRVDGCRPTSGSYPGGFQASCRWPPPADQRYVVVMKLTIELDREIDGRWIAEVPELNIRIFSPAARPQRGWRTKKKVEGRDGGLKAACVLKGPKGKGPQPK